MKKIIILLIIIISLCGCTPNKTPDSVNNSTTQPAQKKAEAEYVKAIWLPYYDLQSFIKGNNEEQFTENIRGAFSELKDMGFNTVTVQVRPCADAFYASSLFPSSQYCFDFQGADMPYDPLKIMCDAASEAGLKIEAWINPYRVSQSNNIDELSDSNIAKKWYNNKKTKSRIYVGKKKIFFNPANEKVIDLIVKGVAEIVENYGVSAIHFDDYFYPTASKKIDKKEYKRYLKNGGTLSLADFRRERVSELIKRTYETIKSLRPEVRFGVSPAANMKTDYNELYADVEKWITDEDYIDYICPQIYFGFKNVYQPFMFTVKKWSYLAKCDMYVGLPLYKAGKPDKYASSDGGEAVNEFVNNDNILARQITYLSKLDNIKGFYVFSYGCLKDERCRAETENMLQRVYQHTIQEKKKEITEQVNQYFSDTFVM